MSRLGRKHISSGIEMLAFIAANVSHVLRHERLGSPCHEWNLSKYQNGYGQTYFAGKKCLVHRLRYCLTVGAELPRTVQLCHRCDNRSCCNPAHLFTGTQAENLADMWQKKRGRRGETHGNSKLSDDNVREIRALLKDGLSQSKCAIRFGVNQSSICDIARGRAWKHVAESEAIPALNGNGNHK